MEPSFRRPPRDSFRQYNPNYTGPGNTGHTGGMMPYHANQPARRGGAGPARPAAAHRLKAGTPYAGPYAVGFGRGLPPTRLTVSTRWIPQRGGRCLRRR